MSANPSEQKRGSFSSLITDWESGLGQLKQRAALGVESVRARLAPIEQKGVKMARATRELSLLTKVELGIAGIGVATAAAELIHAFPYAVGSEDPKDYHPLVVPAVLGMFENMFPPVSSVEDGQVPVPTSVSVTPEGTPLSVGAFPSGTAVVEETGEVIIVTPTATFVPTETATGTPTETPTAEPTPAYRESLTPEQQIIYDAAPIQAGLEKQFLAGGLSEYLAYRDSEGEVTAIYDPERQKVFPALLNGDNNLFINEGSTGATIVYNPKLETDEAVKNAGLVMKYVRARLCARALGLNPPTTVEKITPFMESISGQTCNVTLRAVSENIRNPYLSEAPDWSYSVPKQTLTLTDQTPIVVKFTDSEEGLGEKGNRQMYLDYGRNRETKKIFVVGVAVRQTEKEGPIEFTVFHKGSNMQIKVDYLAVWFDWSMSKIFDRSGGYESGDRIAVFENLLVDFWNGKYDISPLTFGRRSSS